MMNHEHKLRKKCSFPCLCKKKKTSFFVLPSTFRNFADMKKAIVMGASSGMGYEVLALFSSI